MFSRTFYIFQRSCTTERKYFSLANDWSIEMTISIVNSFCQSVDGLNCEMVFSALGIVTAMCIDTINGCIVAGVQDTVRLVDTLVAVFRPQSNI